MKIKENLNDILFIIFFIFHLCTRTWPFGGAFQTFVDIVVAFTAFLLFTHFLLRAFGSPGIRGKLLEDEPLKDSKKSDRKKKHDQ